MICINEIREEKGVVRISWTSKYEPFFKIVCKL
jgi:hypothetical protein